jgi:hypothetical protein
MRFAPKVLFLLLAAVMAAGNAHANSLLISPNPNQGQKFPVQGDCSRNGINPAQPNIDLTRSTWACAGASSQMMRVFYRDGPQDCVYIDNFYNVKGETPAFFVPMQTSDEWLAFVTHLPGGVHLRYGCMGGLLKDACGNVFALPDAPASDDPKDIVKVTSNAGGYEAEFSCPMTTVNAATGKPQPLTASGGCGAWKKTKESGSCGPLVGEPKTPGEDQNLIDVNVNIGNSAPGAPTTNEPTTSILPTTPITNPGGPLIPLQ